MGSTITRETYYGALFALLQTLGPEPAGNGTFSTVDRRTNNVEKMAASELPCLFMTVHTQSTKASLKGPSIYTLRARVIIGCANPDQHTAAGIALNALVDSIERALAPSTPALDTQTFEGLVEACWINGEVEVYEAPLGARAVAIVPVEMILAGP